jgi:hypothetical protein
MLILPNYGSFVTGLFSRISIFLKEHITKWQKLIFSLKTSYIHQRITFLSDLAGRTISL